MLRIRKKWLMSIEICDLKLKVPSGQIISALNGAQA
jgi:hypothetical protein